MLVQHLVDFGEVFGIEEDSNKGKRKVQGVPQSQTAAIPRPEFVSLTLCCFVVWEGLRFVIVALPGLFSYLFFYSTRRFVVCLSVCHFVLVFFSPFSIAIASLGEERANLSAFRTFVRFVLV